jgi:hypothetical protein
MLIIKEGIKTIFNRHAEIVYLYRVHLQNESHVVCNEFKAHQGKKKWYKPFQCGIFNGSITPQANHEGTDLKPDM